MNMNKPTDEPIDFPVGPKEVTALVDIVSRLSLYIIKSNCNYN